MRVERLGLIIGPQTDASIGDDIQGPSLIRVPDWIDRPLGRYYLYFADHKGSYIRLAYADDVAGPWTMHVPGSHFAEGPTLFEPSMRHAAVLVRHDVLHVVWSRVGDAPETLLWSTVSLTDDWMEWTASEPIEILRPDRSWEGADLPVEPSQRSAAPGRVNQLRDPALFDDDVRTLLLDAVAGESGVALAEIDWS